VDGGKSSLTSTISFLFEVGVCLSNLIDNPKEQTLPHSVPTTQFVLFTAYLDDNTIIYVSARVHTSCENVLGCKLDVQQNIEHSIFC
jgi:hypothetical protein